MSFPSGKGGVQTEVLRVVRLQSLDERKGMLAYPHVFSQGFMFISNIRTLLHRSVTPPKVSNTCLYLPLGCVLSCPSSTWYMLPSDTRDYRMSPYHL